MPFPLSSAEVFIATSLDGYIARPDGDIGWLVNRPVPEKEDFGYDSFIAGIGAMVMGRQSFERMVTEAEWPYPVPVVVLSRRPGSVTVPARLADRVRVSGASPRDLMAELAAKGVSRVYVDGGQVIRAYLAERLITRFIVTLIPVLLGQGRPLWGHGPGDLDLRLETVRHWPNGFVQIEYVRA